MFEFNRINVIGLGYIGLPTAATLANAGLSVLGVEVRPSIVDTINKGDIHIHEEGLAEFVRNAVLQGNLRASLSPEPAQAHIIAVPTPVNPDHSPDLSYVESASRTIAQVLQPGDLVILESTVPPCTCERVVAPILKELTGLVGGIDYDLAHCPERVIPGRILHEIVYNDRIIGGVTAQGTQRAAALYRTFVKGQILETDASTAEMCKLMENTFRDVNIALANEFSAICTALGMDVHEAIRMANHHPRVNIHAPGIGVGGHCIPVDPWFIIHSAPEQANLLRVARAINDARPEETAEEIVTHLHENGLTSVALLGLSYKADVDDFRESPALEIAEKVAASTTAQVFIVEPHAPALPAHLQKHAHVAFVSLDEALEKAAAVATLVGHSAFRTVSAELRASKSILDFVRIWS